MPLAASRILILRMFRILRPSKDPASRSRLYELRGSKGKRHASHSFGNVVCLKSIEEIQAKKIECIGRKQKRRSLGLRRSASRKITDVCKHATQAALLSPASLNDPSQRAQLIQMQQRYRREPPTWCRTVENQSFDDDDAHEDATGLPRT